ncbi:Bug family tripartite tricarboxylate transporter substrate binding protein [Paracidovorax avenae]|jgi:tripartite-type tricarboxylate transporter receptor subunit TctC|uniref:Bug family tripartite tricarboxylate transporter substrate binding protein n=1 Tax=Paracidovorax avenae TaxID=80867 RepID=UPI000D215C3D|nr:tripartite tricarboxylate transporter substrate binding protein [Paracidovorax avenae]AVT08496.1 ABC transporter substrate-binding protein [Paracidovorax avenae]
MKKRIVAFLIALAPMVAAAFPDRPIRLVVPMSAGSITDVVARTLADAMAVRLKQPIVVDNQAGGGNLVGTMAAVRAAPDGYTLLMVGVTNGASNLAVMKSLPYDPRKDFTPISLIGESPFLLVSSRSLPVRSAQELAAYGKAHAGKLSYGYGAGSTQLMAARFVSAMGFDATAVGYKGTPQAMADLIGGNTDFVIADLVNGMQAVRSGRVTALGVTSARRTPLTPDIPTLAEQGLKDYDLTAWIGVAAPANTSPQIVALLNATLREVLADPSIKQRFETVGLTVSPTSPEEFGRLIREDIEKWGEIARSTGIAPQ